MNGFDRPMEELEAAREAAEDLLKPSKRDVAAAVKRADYCAYQMSLGYALVENPDMRHLGVLLTENRKLQADLNEAMTHEGAKDCRIDDLEKALFKFGQHTGGCPAWGRPRPDLCACGYVAAFKGNYPQTFTDTFGCTPVAGDPISTPAQRPGVT